MAQVPGFAEVRAADALVPNCVHSRPEASGTNRHNDRQDQPLRSIHPDLSRSQQCRLKSHLTAAKWQVCLSGNLPCCAILDVRSHGGNANFAGRVRLSGQKALSRRPNCTSRELRPRMVGSSSLIDPMIRLACHAAGKRALVWATIGATLVLPPLAIGASDPEIVRARVPARNISRWFPAGTELRVMPAEEFESLVARATKGLARAGSSAAEPRSRDPPRALGPRDVNRPKPAGDRGGFVGSGRLRAHTVEPGDLAVVALREVDWRARLGKTQPVD